MTLAEARTVALANRRMILKGEDPRGPGIPTFEQLAEKVLRVRAPTWKNPEAMGRAWRTEFGYAFRVFGAKPVDRVNSGDVLRVLTPIWNTKRPTAKRVMSRISEVMKLAIAKGYRDSNPAGDAVRAALPQNGRRTAHHKALRHEAVPDAFRKLAGEGGRSDTLALRWIILTACRSAEATGAEWAEIDEGARLWTIPPERAKTDREHQVPLSPAALAVLAEARKNQRKGSGLIFPSPRGKQTSNTSLWRALRRHEIDATAHGFRSGFRDWAAESGVVREVAEACLAHVVGGVEGAYLRSDLLERRRAVMDQWAEVVAG